MLFEYQIIVQSLLEYRICSRRTFWPTIDQNLGRYSKLATVH